MWKIDTTKKGIEAVMKPYQFEIISHLLELREPMGTRRMHAYLEEEGVKVSRASVIIFMKLLAAEGIVNVEDRTGKGGYAQYYSKKLNLEEILTQLVNSVLDAILAAVPKSEYLKYLRSK